VRGSGAITSVATAAKLGALFALVVAAFALGGGESGVSGAGSAAVAKTHWGGVGLALVAALWAYNGFQDMVCVAGEVRDPGRVLPRALMVGTAIVVLVYLSANAAYLYVLPFETLSSSPLVASDVAVRLIGSAGAAAVAGMVMASTFGALTGVMLTQPRIFYAMAVDGLFFGQLARVHPRFGTPHVAVAAYTIASVACVWSRSFEQLAEAFVLGIWPFLALAVAGVVTLRRTRPELHRPYRTPGYPVVPMAFIAGTVWIIGSALWARPQSTLAGIGLTLVGVPIYWTWRALARRRGVAGALPGPSAPPSP
jgi:amino acid transporter